MIPHEEQTREAERQRVYQSVVLKEESSIPLITQEEKRQYAAIIEEMKTTVPGIKKLMADYAVMPYIQVQTLLMYHQYKILKSILERMEAGPGESP